jgi:hypothetical protein
VAASAQGPQAPGGLRAFNGVIDTADVYGWGSHLGYNGKTGLWRLAVTDRAKTIAAASSKACAPEVFEELGVVCGAALERSGRLES